MFNDKTEWDVKTGKCSNILSVEEIIDELDPDKVRCHICGTGIHKDEAVKEINVMSKKVKGFVCKKCMVIPIKTNKFRNS